VSTFEERGAVQGGGEKKKRAGKIQPMFRHRSVQCAQPTDGQIGHDEKRQANEDGEISFVCTHHPINECSQQDNSDKSLQFAQCRCPQTCFAESGWMSLDIAVHVKIPRE
jgi:hypothetical protein